MAILEIITTYDDPGELSFARGGGTVTEITSAYNNEFLIPQGAGVGAVFPDEGDVDFGVQYGSTGTDQTGTLVQPDETDVLNGVQYGADGTEFTGSATGGGGGLISIINE
jgi:hypothetical protein